MMSVPGAAAAIPTAQDILTTGVAYNVTLFDGFGQLVENQAHGPHGIVIAGNGKINHSRITVGINQSYNGDIQLSSFQYRVHLPSDIYYHHYSRQFIHCPDTIQISVKFMLFPPE